MNTSITFNETTYRFSYFQGRDEEKNLTFDCYGIYKNGELDTKYHLEEGTTTSGSGKNKKVEKVFHLYYCNFYVSSIQVKDFSIVELAKVIDYIIKNENK